MPELEWIGKSKVVNHHLGLDVGMVERGIHFPGCSVMVDRQGQYIGTYMPTHPQPKEKIPNPILRDIFDKCLSEYQKQKKEMPHHVLIMRDGFSNEDADFYAKYFQEHGIQYDIIEVRKNGQTRLAYQNGNTFSNPPTMTCLMHQNGKEGYLVTSEGGPRKGAPRPIKIVHTAGNLPFDIIMQICYNLTRNYAGSLQNIRLPLPIYIADKICKAYGRIPHGFITDKNFFM